MPVFELNDQIIFPHPDLAEPNGLLAVGGDLSPQRLVAAYRLGIFPWYSVGDPILWWFTSPRLVLFPDEFRISRRLQRYWRNRSCTMTIDGAFAEVVRCCAETRSPGREDTWITPEMMTAYIDLHHRGYAHSVECWENDHLVGGLYGVCLGRVFFGESMFSHQTNSSKFALIWLVDYLKTHNFKLIDCQMSTAHLTAMGAREIAGSDFQLLLHQHISTLLPQAIRPYETKRINRNL